MTSPQQERCRFLELDTCKAEWPPVTNFVLGSTWSNLHLAVLKLFFLWFCSFMKDFKGKASSSSIEKLKTHPKFPLIETFLETLTSCSREVQHIMIFAKCLINIYLVLVCFTFSFQEGCTSVGAWNSRGWMAYQVQELYHIYWPTFTLIVWKYWQDQKSNL